MDRSTSIRARRSPCVKSDRGPLRQLNLGLPLTMIERAYLPGRSTIRSGAACPVNILLVTSAFYPRWGGTENQARRQAAELARRGHAVTVLTWQKDPALPRMEPLDGFRIRRVPRQGSGAYHELGSLLRMMAALLREAGQVDVICVHQLLIVAHLAALAGLLTCTPVVGKAAITAAAPDSDVRPLDGTGRRARLLRILAFPLRRTAIAVAISGEIAGDLHRLGFRRIVRIPNGVADRGPVDRRAVRSALCTAVDLPPDVPLVAAAGRFVAWKGFGDLLDAWAVVHCEQPRAILLVIGAGEEEVALRVQVEALGLHSAVRFVPASPAAAYYLTGADVVATPSHFDGMSNVLLEAMIAAVPVVATAVSGSVDLIRDGENGRLVPPGDAGALAAALLDVLADPGDLGAAGRRTALTHCELGLVVDQYEALFTAATVLPPGLYAGADLAGRSPDDSDRGSRVEAAGK
jgi:glycosyltransferase involved in cell wall biosynthesis